MIEYIKGDLLDTDCDIIAHGCNAQGVMGAGVAKQIKEKHPEAFIQYSVFIHSEQKPVGKVYWAYSKGKIIANCITQVYYGRGNEQYIDYEAIRSCCKILNDVAQRSNKSIAMPKIGAGLGGGDWNIIEQIINEELSDKTVKVYTL